MVFKKHFHPAGNNQKLTGHFCSGPNILDGVCCGSSSVHAAVDTRPLEHFGLFHIPFPFQYVLIQVYVKLSSRVSMLSRHLKHFSMLLGLCKMAILM